MAKPTLDDRITLSLNKQMSAFSDVTPNLDDRIDAKVALSTSKIQQDRALSTKIKYDLGQIPEIDVAYSVYADNVRAQGSKEFLSVDEFIDLEQVQPWLATIPQRRNFIDKVRESYRRAGDNYDLNAAISLTSSEGTVKDLKHLYELADKVEATREFDPIEDDTSSREADFTAFVRETQDPLRHALTAGFGVEVGREVAEEAMVYAWRHWDRVGRMKNPRGYLYRVGHRMAQKTARSRPAMAFPDMPDESNPLRVEPGLPAALRHLSARQRTAVVLVCAYGLSQREAAQMLGITRSSVRRHMERGLARLRIELGVTSDD